MGYRSRIVPTFPRVFIPADSSDVRTAARKASMLSVIPYLAYPLEGKKHSPILPRAEFEKVMAASPDYRRIEKMELETVDEVKELSVENKALMAEVKKLQLQIINNDKKALAG